MPQNPVDGRTLRSRGLVTVLLIGVLLSAAAPAAAECVRVAPDVPAAFQQADVVFTGNLVKAVDQTMLTFRADRIWKGQSPHRDIVVYELESPSVESYAFREGERYLIFARELSPSERASVGQDSKTPPSFVMRRSCGGPPWPLELSKELDELARSRRR